MSRSAFDGTMRAIASRLKPIQPSATVRLAALVNEMKRRGEDIVSFSVGEPDFPTPPHIVDAAKKALDDGWTKYVAPGGIPALREAIAEKSKRENGIPCEPEGVLVAPTKHALFLAVMGLVDAGDEVLVDGRPFAKSRVWGMSKTIEVPLGSAVMQHLRFVFRGAVKPIIDVFLNGAPLGTV